MKKILFILSVVTATIISSCKKGLDPQLYGSLSTTSFPITEQDFQSYVLEVYKPFQSKWGYGDPAGYENDWFSPEYGDVMRNEYPTDILNVFTGYGGFFQQFSSSSFNFLVNQGTGSNHYEKIRFVSRITKIIDDVDKSSISPASKTLYTAEAKMSRAWNMYFLLQDYGPVPVILDPSKVGNTDAENNLTRPSRADYLASIINDLTYAAANLPKSPADYGRFNQGLALTVMMRTYMNEKDFVNAEKIGRQIMAMGYTLITDYSSLFKDATEKNSETIWAVTCTPGADGGENHGSFNALAFYVNPADYPGHNITGSFAPKDAPFSCTWAFYNSFDANDARRSPLIASYTNKTGGITNRASGLAGPVIAKYPDTGPSPVNTPQGNDQPKARLGEVMLYLAEAINQNSGPTAEAVALVNQVRAAHGGSLLGQVPATATASKTAFDAWLLKEEGWETYFEGERRLDLVRHGAWQSVLATVGKTAGPYLFPVPQYALTQSGGKLTQTPGY